MPPLAVCFWISFAATLLFVGCALVTGRRGRRAAHLAVALSAVAFLAVTVVLAEKLGRARNFPPDVMRIHLWFAKSAALMVVPVALTGIALWFRPRMRTAHRAAIALFLLLTVIATVTGTWAFALSTPK